MDRYLIADLEPITLVDLHTRSTKTSARTHGSLTMALRKPSRMPENARRYVPGDPVQLIDWTAYARTDELIIREHREDTLARVAIVIDRRWSQQWPDLKALAEHQVSEGLKTKFEISVRIGLFVGFSQVSLGDVVDFCFIDDSNQIQKLFQARSPSDVSDFFHLAVSQGFKETTHGEHLTLVESFKSYDQVLWVSDFLSDGARIDLPKFIKKLRVIHVFNALELDLKWTKDQFSYLAEEHSSQRFVGSELRGFNRWDESLLQWQKKIQGQVSQIGGKYLMVHDQMDAELLIHWLSHEGL